MSSVRGLLQRALWVTSPHGLCVQGLLVTPTGQQNGQGALPTRKRKSIYDTVTDSEMVEQVFGFLPSMIGGHEGQASPGFEVRWAPSFTGQARSGAEGQSLPSAELSPPVGSLGRQYFSWGAGRVGGKCVLPSWVDM